MKFISKGGEVLSDYDVLIIGSGPGGYVAAEEAALLGNSVAVIEKKDIGGVCLNTGCIPSKTYLEHAHWLNTIGKANSNGIEVEIKNIDFPSLVDRKDGVVSTLQKGIMSTFKANNIDYIQGEAIHKEGRTFEVDGRSITGKNILLATGGHPFIADIPGLQEADYLTTDTIFDMTELPEKFVTIGGGIIAVELAFAMKAYGIDVTLLEVAEDILLTIDEDARQIIRKRLEALGVDVRTKVSIEEVKTSSVDLTDGSSFGFDRLLVAIGRRANLELPEVMGLDLDDSGRFVAVDEYYETSAPGVYAIGDLIGGHTLAHAASAEGIKAVRAMSNKKETPVNPLSIPRSLYTDPEVAEFGLSESEAATSGYDVITEKLPFSFNGRAISAGETDGFVKIISESRYRRILGAVVVGPHATDLIHQLLAVYESEGTIDEIAGTVYGHPTLSELIQDVSKNIIKNH